MDPAAATKRNVEARPFAEVGRGAFRKMIRIMIRIMIMIIMIMVMFVFATFGASMEIYVDRFPDHSMANPRSAQPTTHPTRRVN